ncbi:MAG: hypothetical protein GX957_01950 [Clostridiaceae bacterium]|nr:hypothetical protein [Clostridiaceae bacterium]
MKEKKTSILKLFLSFLKVGTIGFGGGSALIPVVEKELVQNQKSMSDQDYLKHTVVANITPGALPVKLGATCGYQLKGIGGSLAGALGVTIPGLIFTVAFMALFSILGGEVINYFNYASVGITAFIVFLLISYVVKTVRLGDFRINMFLCISAFALTGGKEIREILSLITGIDYEAFGTPLFDISTIDLIVLAFFVILLLEKLKSRTELYMAFGLGLVYAFFKGKTGTALGLKNAGNILLLIMIAIVVVLYIVRRQKSQNKSRISFQKSDLLIVGIFLFIPLVLAVLSHMLFPISSDNNIVDFLIQIGSSTITSFGGGEAYVSVADGFFVQGGYIKPDEFYTRLVPVANSLPGPILVKIAAGIGFLFGQQNGGAAAGWFIAVTAGMMAVGVCCAVAMIVLALYDSVKEWQFITNLKKYILPVICGMLISTSGAMIFESMKITGGKGIPGFISFPAILLFVYAIHLLHKKFHLHDVLLLLISAVFSLLVLII